jgi:predicted peptidase
MWQLEEPRTMLNNRKLVFILLFFIGGLFKAHSQALNIKKPKVNLDYLIYLPTDYESNFDTDFPLIIYLHGGSQRGENLELLKGYGIPRLIEEGKNYDFIIASPQCPDTTYWSQIDWFESLYLELNSKYRINTAKVFVTGISMGGFGTWHAAMDYPDLVKAIVPLCGGCNDSIDICKISHIPIWTFHGELDNLIPINETERLVNRLIKCSANVKFTRLENQGHGIHYLYEKEDIYNWLK